MEKIATLQSVAVMLLLATCLQAQSSYFQQEVHYTIEVTLNDRQHTLSGTVEMNYINHSPHTLDKIYMHLWPNAYADRNTAFARQQLRNGDTKFHFANQEERGGFSGLDFTVNDERTRIELQPNNPDIGVLRLSKPLAPGASVRIKTPFRLRIPASFSRLGHVGESYQITQWYPKPAVYDQQGWHPMPYLNQGEFYSEFGSFDVRITLPDNYVVGATGTLQTESEIAFLQRKMEESNERLQLPVKDKQPDTEKSDFPESSQTMKTLHYKADQVHDFAWFADKRFYVQKGQVTLSSGRTVDTWAMFTDVERNLWKDAINYINRSVLFYSEHVGEYPYPHATAVQSALSAGGGMEYPMITVIGEAGSPRSLDIVITHEVGHNWFYGILGSNERDHAWMDEGLNSYYEKRYTRQYYGNNSDLQALPQFIMRGNNISTTELIYLWQARRRQDQAPTTTSDQLTSINYFLSAYEKPAVALQHLEAYLGTAVFDAAMQQYYQQWQFKHPQPQDFRQSLESSTNKDLSWLFDGLLYSNNHLDYAISGVQKQNDAYEVSVKNKGRIAAPFQLDALKDGRIVQSQWYEGFEGLQTLSFPVGDYDLIVLDEQRILLDINRNNNNIRTSGVFKTIEPLQVSLLPRPEDSKRTQLYWLPAMGWNNYDKYMLGAALYNTTAPYRNLRFTAIPMYSFGSNDIAGFADMQYYLYPNTPALQRIIIGANGRVFHYDRNFTSNYDLQYVRVEPFLRFELGKLPASNLYQTIQWRSIWLNAQQPIFSDMFGNFIRTDWNDTFIHELSYELENRRKLNPYSLIAAVEQQSYDDNLHGKQQYVKASLEWNSSYTFQPNKSFDVRLFAGGFLSNTRRNAGGIFPGAFNLTSQGFNDYRFDDWYFGRSDRMGIWAQQVSIRDGGMKNVIGTGFNLGRSNSFIVAINLKSSLPSGLPFHKVLKPYFDIGYFDNAMPMGANDSFSDQLLWSGGLQLELVRDIFNIYFPLINSQNLQDRYAEQNSYLQRVSFSLNLARLNPYRFLERLAL